MKKSSISQTVLIIEIVMFVVTFVMWACTLHFPVIPVDVLLLLSCISALILLLGSAWSLPDSLPAVILSTIALFISILLPSTFGDTKISVWVFYPLVNVVAAVITFYRTAMQEINEMR